MELKTVSQLDSAGYFVGLTNAHPSPLEKEVWLIPALAIDVPPPEIPAGQRAQWTGNS
ncbi:hypothetical protein AGMMS50256_14270 [Betaproteobacteria bacterium]|nr:hypothetical protein AGMMS50256_14270 [Betaproteobacteria bacterium]